MVFNISQSYDDKLQGFYDKAMKELSGFYEMIWNEEVPIIYILNTREEINKITSEKTPDWLVGFTLGFDRYIYLLNPESYDTESSHKYSDEYFYQLMKHELSHLYSMIFYKGLVPIWLIEGLAIYSSGQLKSKKRPQKFEKFLEYFKKEGSDMYDESGFAVEIMIKDKGKKHFLDFYKAQKDVKTVADLEKLFKEYYGEELNYEYFNNRQ